MSIFYNIMDIFMIIDNKSLIVFKGTTLNTIKSKSTCLLVYFMLINCLTFKRFKMFHYK